jgi:O-antigen/teichoic acid export membrane protein
VSGAGSAVRRLLVQASHYSLASVMTMLAGLVTFPVLTRLFSVSDYGAMNLVAATISVSVAFGKVGLQHSIVRYQSEISAGKSRFTLEQLFSTTLIGMSISALVVVAALVGGTHVVPQRWLGEHPEVRFLITVASGLIVVQVLESALVNFLRAEQNTAALMKYQVGKKYLGLGLILTSVLVISRSLTAFYAASVLAEGLAVITLFALLVRRGHPVPTPAQFSTPLYKNLLSFGIPMMIGYELSGLILSVGDRYVIDGLLGQEQLGLYAAAYNLCQYVQAAIIASIGQAIMPIYMQMWDRQGADETAAFIERSLRTYVMFGAPIIAGMAAVATELLPSLASSKYTSASGVLPWVIAGMVVDGTNAMVGAGLFIHRKTRTIMVIVLACAGLNIGLNFILIPRLGIIGAAVATLVSYAATSLAMAVVGHRLLAVRIPWGTLARAGAAAAVMYAAVVFLAPGRRFLTVGVRAAVGAVVYGGLMALIDADARAIVTRALARLRR